MKAFSVLGGLLAGFLLAVGALYFVPVTQADNSCLINQNELTLLYNLAFHRQPDAGASGYLGQGLDFSLNQLLASPENQYYSGVYAAVKQLENAERSNTPISRTAESVYYSSVSQALQNLEQWANPSASIAPIYESSSSSSSSGTAASAPAPAAPAVSWHTAYTYSSSATIHTPPFSLQGQQQKIDYTCSKLFSFAGATFNGIIDSTDNYHSDVFAWAVTCPTSNSTYEYTLPPGQYYLDLSGGSNISYSVTVEDYY